MNENCGYQEDCIHLKACRRLQKICRTKYDIKVGRSCNKDCSAYEACTLEQVYKVDDASRHIWRLLEEVARHDPYDIFATWDIPSYAAVIREGD